MKIGIFGGSFDPPHFGHLQIAKSAKEHFNLDEVWFVPVFVSPFKTEDPPVAAEHRLAMLNLLIEGHHHYKVLDFEVLKKRPSYTVDSLEYLTKKYPEDEFYLLLGDDALQHFLSWRNPEEIVKMVRLAVAPRNAVQDFSFLKQNPPVYEAASAGLLPMPLIKVSSTEVRSLAKKQESLEKYTPKKIADYINQHRLYTQTST